VTTQLSLLDQACPAWFEILTRLPGRIDGLARIAPWTATGVAVTLREDAAALVVAEATPGTVFPARCAERHIQGDETFCVGLNRPKVTKRRDAEGWWFNLHQFLECQAIAATTGLWPPRNALDHGTAGVYQQRALQLARWLGIEADYWEAYFGHTSWISTPPSAWAHPKDPVPHRRLRKPAVKRSRRARGLLLELVFTERKRRIALDRYNQAARRWAGDCCGTMRDCAIKAARAAPE
jgi:hypothetical protein